MTSTASEIREIAEQKSSLPGALLPILHAIQDRFGYLPGETVATVADVLNQSRAEVHGVISFYHFFRETPPGARTIFVCRSEACQAMGANALADHAKRSLNVDFHEVTEDGRFGLEPVYCLGNCACAPAIMVGETVYGRVDKKRWDEIVG